MKNVFIVVVLVFFGCKKSNNNKEKLKSSINKVNSFDYDTIKGFYDLDDNEDFIIVKKDEENVELICELFIKKANSYHSKKKFTIDESFSGLIYGDITNCIVFFTGVKGQYGVQASCCASTKDYETEVYEFEPQLKDWKLNESYEYSYRPEPYFNLSNHQKTVNNVEFDTIHKLLKQGKIKENSSKFNLVEIGKSLHQFDLNKKTLTKLNDIAYYLEKGEFYSESVFILNKIIKSFPNRTVAYINLGDAYWGLGNFSKAKQAYKTYIEQMKVNRKEAKIPKQVLERVK